VPHLQGRGRPAPRGTRRASQPAHKPRRAPVARRAPARGARGLLGAGPGRGTPAFGGTGGIAPASVRRGDAWGEGGEGRGRGKTSRSARSSRAVIRRSSPAGDPASPHGSAPASAPPPDRTLSFPPPLATAAAALGGSLAALPFGAAPLPKCALPLPAGRMSGTPVGSTARVRPARSARACAARSTRDTTLASASHTCARARTRAPSAPRNASAGEPVPCHETYECRRCRRQRGALGSASRTQIQG